MLDCQQAQASTGRPPPNQEKMSLSAIWQTLVRTHRLPEGTDIPPLVSSLRDRLHDPEKEVRQYAARVLADLILALPKNSLKQHIRPLLPSMIANLGHTSLAVRKSVLDCLKVYIKHSPTPNDDFLEVIRTNDETPQNVLNGILTFIPSLVRPDVLSMDSIERAVDTLWNFSQQCVNEEICLKSLAKIRWKIGPTMFDRVIHVDRLKRFNNLSEKYGLFETADEDYSSSTSEDKLILETEIQLDSGSSIKLQIHEESSDREFEGRNPGILRVLEDDSDIEFYESTRGTPRTPRRVHFGGEIVKMRTPESDSTQTSDSEKKVRKPTSTPAQSFVKVQENIDPTRKPPIKVRKRMSKSLDNLTAPPETKTSKITKIPIPKNLAPNTSTKTPQINKPRLHNSAPNLSRTSKIPKKLTSDKGKSNIKTTFTSESKVKQNGDVKDVVPDADQKFTHDSTVYMIKENMKMIELNIKNNIALQILFSNGNDTPNGKNETAVKITELPPEPDPKVLKKEDFTQTDTEQTHNSKNGSMEKERPMSSESKPHITKTEQQQATISNKTEITETKSEVSSESIDKKNIPSTSKTTADQKSSKKLEIDNKPVKKGKNLPKLNIPKPKEEIDKQPPSPLIDEEALLECGKQPRRYSRAEDILSPVPVHNEIQILHNLARSPEHRKTKSRPTTATIKPQPQSRPGTATIQKTYESFRVFPDDLTNNNFKGDVEKTDGQNASTDEVQIESKPEVTSAEDGTTTTEAKKEDIKIKEAQTGLPGPSCLGTNANGFKPQYSLPEIISHLREMDLTKNPHTFDSIVNSLQDAQFLETFDADNLKHLLQLLFLYETQARYRKGSRDALYSILENVPEAVMKECLPQIAKGIGRMGAPHGIKLAIIVMKRTHFAELLNHLPFESSRGREGSLQILIAASRLFPSTDVKVEDAIKLAVSTMKDRKRKVKHASLEALASLAQVGGNTTILEIAKKVLKDEENKENLLNVIRARLSRRQLPMVDFDGNIRYTIPREQIEIDWLCPGGQSNHSAPSLLQSLQRNGLRQGDDLVPLKGSNAAVIPLDLQQKRLAHRKGILRPVYCILPSPEESDEGPPFYYPEDYIRGRSILPPTEKTRSESQDRSKWKQGGPRRRFSTKYDIRKSFSSDQLYHSQPISLDYRNNVTSTSSVSSGSDYSSSNGSQSRSIHWQGSGIPVLRPRGYWGSYSDKSSANIENLWGLRDETKYKFPNIFNLCSCLKRRSRIGDVTKMATPILETSTYPEPEKKSSHESPSSIRSIQRQSSGSESSGYFTPPHAERPSAAPSPVQRPDSVIKAVTPLESPQRIVASAKEPLETQTSTDEPPGEETVEYIEVINSIPQEPTIEKLETETLQTKSEYEPTEQVTNFEEDHNDPNTNRKGLDETDRKASCPSMSEFDLEITRPIVENRKWSRSEANLEKSLPIIVDRKNVNSAPLIKDISNNNATADVEEKVFNAPTHICNNTNINITIPLPGTLIQEEELPPEPTFVRRLSKRYSQVPVPKRAAQKSKTDSARGSSKSKSDVLRDILHQMSSPEWEVVMTGLRNLGKLAKTNNEIMEPHMHTICLALSNQIKNLRSQVARAACQASKEMFISCSQKGLEAELEEIVGPLLHRTADTNKFLREDANNALNVMTEKIHPAKVVTVLTSKGTTHQNAIVRCTTTRLLELLFRIHGTEKLFSLGKEVRDRAILAGANALTEGSLETRKHAKALLRHMISYPNFQKALLEAVPPHTIRHIAKTLNSLKSSQ
ncbi:uncharacterized protein LOC123310412 [Coccinella septempunctata]|uniref:uncharacterized protein LOC123310412 n=1 Tax=Coccinella septempunctata TaxID=41139 RepID=UPI001D06FE49|nr:uncharacterized protein LOC123310412 [Coccinella septempunctata]